MSSLSSGGRSRRPVRINTVLLSSQYHDEAVLLRLLHHIKQSKTKGVVEEENLQPGSVPNETPGSIKNKGTSPKGIRQHQNSSSREGVPTQQVLPTRIAELRATTPVVPPAMLLMMMPTVGLVAGNHLTSSLSSNADPGGESPVEKAATESPESNVKEGDVVKVQTNLGWEKVLVKKRLINGKYDIVFLNDGEVMCGVIPRILRSSIQQPPSLPQRGGGRGEVQHLNLSITSPTTVNTTYHSHHVEYGHHALRNGTVEIKKERESNAHDGVITTVVQNRGANKIGPTTSTTVSYSSSSLTTPTTTTLKYHPPQESRDGGEDFSYYRHRDGHHMNDDQRRYESTTLLRVEPIVRRRGVASNNYNRKKTNKTMIRLMRGTSHNRRCEKMPQQQQAHGLRPLRASSSSQLLPLTIPNRTAPRDQSSTVLSSLITVHPLHHHDSQTSIIKSYVDNDDNI